jgi:hypothetical protein
MPHTFKILTAFLDRFADEVEGRGLEELTPNTRSKLEQLARGQLPETERSELFATLSRHPEWIARLAQEIKALRPGTD